jgi:ATP adenylyltransferase
MEHLWSPWRLAYITGSSQPTGCVFCPSTLSSARSEESEFESLLVFRGHTCYIILNLFPYNSGHLMVVPNRHLASLADATPEELSELIELTRRAEMALTEAYAPHGMNMGINLGKPAGAGVLGHVHMHVVPRWTGDTNFMSVVGETRVLPEELPATAARLRPIFERLGAGGRNL